MDVMEFLKWLFGSAGSIMAASWVLERIPWFQAQVSDVKEWLFFALSAVFSISSYLVITYVPVATLNMIAPYFTIVSGLFFTIIISKMFHSIDKKPE